MKFEELDLQKYPCYELVLESGNRGGTFPAVAATVNEVAVNLFLENKLPFLGISRLLAEVLDMHSGVSEPALEEIVEAEAWAERVTLERGKSVFA